MKWVFVNCSRHGEQSTAMVCQHLAGSLVDGQAVGFVTAPLDPQEKRPDALCRECAERLRTVGEWTPEFIEAAQIQLLCGACYDELRELSSEDPRSRRH